MKRFAEIEYVNFEENKELENLINKVLEECFKTEKIDDYKLYISVTLTNPEYIRKLNKEYRNIDKETDVLSFPMFEKYEIKGLNSLEFEETLGDIVVSIERVEEQAKEYGVLGNNIFGTDFSFDLEPRL